MRYSLRNMPKPWACPYPRPDWLTALSLERHATPARYSLPKPIPSNYCGCGISRALSINHAQQERRLPALEPRELSGPRRCEVVKHGVKIPVIRHVKHVETETNLARAAVADRKMEVPVDLKIQGKECRKPLPVRQPNIILPIVYFGIGKTSMQIYHRAKNQGVRKVEYPPDYYPVGNIRWPNTVYVRPDDRLLNRDGNVPKRVH